MVVGLHHGHDQAAGGNLGAGPRHRLRRQRAPVVRDPLQGNVLVNIALAEVFVHSIGADESPGGRAVALGVEKSRVVVHTRQQGGAALHAVFFRETVRGQRGAILRTILARAGDGVLQSHGQGSCARRLIWAGVGVDRIERVLSGGDGDQARHCEGELNSLAEHAAANMI